MHWFSWEPSVSFTRGFTLMHRKLKCCRQKSKEKEKRIGYLVSSDRLYSIVSVTTSDGEYYF